jgi:hypothetical protein
VKAHEAAGAFLGVLAALCLGVAGETWVMGAMGAALGAMAAVAWFWKPSRRRT